MSKHLDKTIIGIDPNKIRKLTGSCLCGGVSYKINGPVRDIVNCFCEQCRKTSGHHVAATRVNKDHLELVNEETLEWFECLPDVFRGFCNTCGGSLFWDNKTSFDNEIAVMAGTLDAPTNLKTIGNIFTEDASDYCQIVSYDNDE